MAFALKCMDCGHTAPFSPSTINCPDCKSQWREAEYDYPLLAATLPGQLRTRPFDLWRYRELLPINNPNLSLSLGEAVRH